MQFRLDHTGYWQLATSSRIAYKEYAPPSGEFEIVELAMQFGYALLRGSSAS